MPAVKSLLNYKAARSGPQVSSTSLCWIRRARATVDAVAPGGCMVVAEATRCLLNHTVPAAHSGSIWPTLEDPPASMIKRFTLPGRAALRRFSGGWLTASHSFARLPSGLVPRSTPAWLTRRMHAWALCLISSSVSSARGLRGMRTNPLLSPGTNASNFRSWR